MTYRTILGYAALIVGANAAVEIAFDEPPAWLTWVPQWGFTIVLLITAVVLLSVEVKRHGDSDGYIRPVSPPPAPPSTSPTRPSFPQPPPPSPPSPPPSTAPREPTPPWLKELHERTWLFPDATWWDLGRAFNANVTLIAARFGVFSVAVIAAALPALALDNTLLSLHPFLGALLLGVCIFTPFSYMSFKDNYFDRPVEWGGVDRVPSEMLDEVGEYIEDLQHTFPWGTLAAFLCATGVGVAVERWTSASVLFAVSLGVVILCLTALSYVIAKPVTRDGEPHPDPYFTKRLNPRVIDAGGAVARGVKIGTACGVLVALPMSFIGDPADASMAGWSALFFTATAAGCSSLSFQYWVVTRFYAARKGFPPDLVGALDKASRRNFTTVTVRPALSDGGYYIYPRYDQGII